MGICQFPGLETHTVRQTAGLLTEEFRLVFLRGVPCHLKYFEEDLQTITSWDTDKQHIRTWLQNEQDTSCLSVRNY